MTGDRGASKLLSRSLLQQLQTFGRLFWEEGVGKKGETGDRVGGNLTYYLETK